MSSENENDRDLFYTLQNYLTLEWENIKLCTEIKQVKDEVKEIKVGNSFSVQY